MNLDEIWRLNSVAGKLIDWKAGRDKILRNDGRLLELYITPPADKAREFSEIRPETWHERVIPLDSELIKVIVNPMDARMRQLCIENGVDIPEWLQEAAK